MAKVTGIGIAIIGILGFILETIFKVSGIGL